jgi:hypothetical protein
MASNANAPTLVLLAAGLGRRYGGLKQLEPVGPDGATLMDYSIYDALRAGFGRVVFVIRPDMQAVAQALLGRRYERRVDVRYAHQRLDTLPAGFAPPPGRTRPWGTCQALLAAAEHVDGPFAVANADDFYGAGSFAALGAFLRQDSAGPLPTYAMAGYTMRNTLPEQGTVSRAICRCSADGWLQSIVEVIGIERCGADARHVDDSGQTQIIPGDTLVSMNLWGFTPAIFDQLRDGFQRFLHERGGSPEAEFHLPTAVQQALAARRARVRVLPSTDAWCGVTHAQDKARATEVVGRLLAQGVYPKLLWG